MILNRPPITRVTHFFTLFTRFHIYIFTFPIFMASNIKMNHIKILRFSYMGGWFVLWLVTIKKVPVEKMNGTNTYRTKSLRKLCCCVMWGKTACMQKWQSYKILCLINHRCSKHFHLPDNRQTQSSNLIVKNEKKLE